MLVLFLLGAGAAIAADSTVSKEYQVKAAFLYNFAKYVEWPSNSFTGTRAPFVIGVLGPDRFGKELDVTVAGRTINERPIVIKRLTRDADAADCNILYVSAADKARYVEILGPLKGRSVLTVGEGERFLETGGVIAFIVKEDKVRFQIDLGVARDGAMSINSRLLSVAEKVRSKGEEVGH